MVTNSSYIKPLLNPKANNRPLILQPINYFASYLLLLLTLHLLNPN